MASLIGHGPIRMVRLDRDGYPCGPATELQGYTFDCEVSTGQSNETWADDVWRILSGTLSELEISIPKHKVDATFWRFMSGYRNPPFLRWLTMIEDHRHCRCGRVIQSGADACERCLPALLRGREVDRQLVEAMDEPRFES